MKENVGGKRRIRRMKHVSICSLTALVVMLMMLYRSQRINPNKNSNSNSLASESVSPLSIVKGFATPSSTAFFASDAVRHGAHPSFYRVSNGTSHTVSSMGMGTSRGDQSEETDALYVNALITSVNGGVNVIDTSSNYRNGNAELCVGRALRHLLADGVDVGVSAAGNTAQRRRQYHRSEIFISSKAGSMATRDLKQRAVQKGAVKQDFWSHHACFAPACIEASIDISLERMQIETIDLLYLHNIAEQMSDASSSLPGEITRALQRAFEHLESERQRGRIRYYGLATFSKSFRVLPEESGALNLGDVVALAQKAAGCSTDETCRSGFRFVQLPVSPHSMPEMYTLPSQRPPSTSTSTSTSTLEKNDNPSFQTLAQTAQDFNIGIFSSRSLGSSGRKGRTQAKCLDWKGLPPSVGAPLLPNLYLQTDILHVTRSSPGLLCALVGHKTPANVESNLKLASIPPLNRHEFESVVKKCTA